MKIPKDIKEKLFKLPNVISVGWGERVVQDKPIGEKGVIVGVRIKIPISALAEDEVVPKKVNGIDTDVQVMPDIHIKPAFLYPLSYIARYRPYMGGVSCGHPSITAGTLGAFCLDMNDNLCLLTNNHVAANSNQANIGDPVYQPGPYDGGTSSDVIAELAHFTHITMNGLPDIPDNCGNAKLMKRILDVGLTAVGSRFRISFEPAHPFAVANLTDSAICRVTNKECVLEIKDIGKIKGTLDAYLGMPIHKTGRTTEHTEGKVTQIDVAISVQYGAGQVAYFDDQIISDIKSDGGDSGSAILDLDNRITGLLFAGGEGVTVFNRIQNVMKAEGIKEFI